MMPVPPLGRRSNLGGPHRIEGDGWSLTELPPLTGPIFGVALVSGGQATAQASAHALVVPESARNRYRVRPFELTRIFPRLDFATRTVAGFAFVASCFAAGTLAELTPP
jgi:hypothetical protein